MPHPRRHNREGADAGVGHLALSSGNSGWKCDHGYIEVDGRCDAIKVPANGYVFGRSYAQGRECDRGYRRARAACVVVELPENAHLDFSGNDWECNQPYRERQHRCGLGDRNE
jgi:hypothetical protein